LEINRKINTKTTSAVGVTMATDDVAEEKYRAYIARHRKAKLI